MSLDKGLQNQCAEGWDVAARSGGPLFPVQQNGKRPTKEEGHTAHPLRHLEAGDLYVQAKHNPQQMGQRNDPEKSRGEERTQFHADLQGLGPDGMDPQGRF